MFCLEASSLLSWVQLQSNELNLQSFWYQFYILYQPSHDLQAVSLISIDSQSAWSTKLVLNDHWSIFINGLSLTYFQHMNDIVQQYDSSSRYLILHSELTNISIFEILLDQTFTFNNMFEVKFDSSVLWKIG